MPYLLVVVYGQNSMLLHQKIVFTDYLKECIGFLFSYVVSILSLDLFLFLCNIFIVCCTSQIFNLFCSVMIMTFKYFGLIFLVFYLH